MSERDECRETHHAAALVVLKYSGQDLHTECVAGHEQLEISECDGVHCYRPCDEVARTRCRRIWKMRVLP